MYRSWEQPAAASRPNASARRNLLPDRPTYLTASFQRTAPAPHLPERPLCRRPGTSCIRRSLIHAQQVLARPVVVKHHRPTPHPQPLRLARGRTRPVNEGRQGTAAISAHAVFLCRNQRSRSGLLGVPDQHHRYGSSPIRLTAFPADLHFVVFLIHRRPPARAIPKAQTEPRPRGLEGHGPAGHDSDLLLP
jgi:hypothetical protein